MNKRLLYAATSYRKAGWNVVPLFNHTKIPDGIETWSDDFGWISGWDPLKERMSTEKEFKYWFEEQEPTGLGVITGKISSIVVVDEDSYKGNGMKFEFPSPLVSRTARGGSHHFFKYVEGIKTSGFRQGINIEIKSDGGFIVLPPTEVFTDDNKTKKGWYAWIAKCPLDQLPEISEEKLKKYRGNSSGGRVIEDIHELLNSTRGYQHNNLRSLALVLLNRFQSSEWDLAVKTINQEAHTFVPVPPQREIDAMIKTCMKYIKDHPKSTVEAEILAEKKVGLKPRTIKEVALERLSEKELEKVAPSTGYKELDGLIKGFIPGHLYTVTGDTNVGKTSLACNFTDRIRRQKKRVLYFALEPENTVVDYLASIRANKEYSLLTPEDIMFDDEYIGIFGKEEISSLQDLITIIDNSEIRYDVIFIDHIGYFIKDKDNTNQDQSNTVKALAGLAKKKKIAIVLIAHLRKKGANQKKDYMPTADDISGSGAFKQDSTEVLIVTRKKATDDPNDPRLSNEGVIWVVKTKAGPNGAVPVFFGERRAGIFTRDEMITRVDMSPSDSLTMMGFPDVSPLDL